MPKTGQKAPSPRGDGSGVPVDWGAAPKTGQKTPSARIDAHEVLVSRVAVPKTGRGIGKRPI